MNYKLFSPFLISCLLALSCLRQEPITIETLLDEIVSIEQIAEFPDPYYRGMQASSYDRRSISPDSANWGANNDGYQGGHFIRIDTINGRIEKVNNQLLDPPLPESELTSVREKGKLLPGEIAEVVMPEGENLVNQMRFQIDIPDSLNYGEIMRELILSIEFDGEETVNTPLGDFAGGGIGAYEVKSWYLDNNGRGFIDSRWPMPYKENAKLTLTNNSDYEVLASIIVMTRKKAWYRTRNLDGIPFQEKFQFDFELLSWFVGEADYSSTVYWYEK